MLLSYIPALKFLILTILSSRLSVSEQLEYCENQSESREDSCKSHDQNVEKRYILYDVNPSEGFNLRRDVYVRIAAFVKKCNDLDYNVYQWNLVLPPWEKMYHWRSKELGEQRQIPWGTFFDISSLKRYIPVLEMYDYVRETNFGEHDQTIDRVYILENDMKMFETGNFKEKNELIDCPKKQWRYRKVNNNEYTGYFWGYSNVTSREVKCLVFHGTTSGLRKNLEPQLYRSFMFDRMEIPLHDNYGSREYWRARRSMRYNNELYEIAEKYITKYLGSENSVDNTLRVNNWKENKGRRDATGGPYLAVHLRRRDFLHGRAESVPTIESAASQLRKKLIELDLQILFVATDADDDEYENLRDLLINYRVYKYIPNKHVKAKFKDGGVAIIDQIICSHARYFIGTHESTFTFRIQEDREIMGFPTNTTFNRLCGREKECSSGGQWEIVW